MMHLFRNSVLCVRTLCIFAVWFILGMAMSCSQPVQESKEADIDTLISQGFYEQARTSLSNALVSQPRDSVLLYNLATVERMMGEIPAAKTTAMKALQYAPKDDNILLLLADIAIEQGDVETAWDQFQLISETGQIQPRAQITKGTILANQRKWAEAESALQAALKLGQPSARTKSILAYVVVQQGRIEEGKAQLAEAEAMGDESIESNRQIAECYLDLGDAKRASELVLPLITKRPNDAHLFSLLGRCQMILLRFSEAESAFTRALVCPNATPWTKVDYAIMLFAAQREDEALAQVSEAESDLKAQNIPIRNPSLFNLLATLYARKSNLMLANQYLEQSLLIDANQPKVRDLIQKIQEQTMETAK